MHHTLAIIGLAVGVIVALGAISFLVRSKRAKRLTRTSTILPLLITALSLSGAAFAAFVIFGGASGSGTGSFAAATSQSAITITESGTPPALNSGGFTDVPATYTNNNATAAETLSTLTGTFTSTDSTCNAALGSHLNVGQFTVSPSPIPAGGTATGTFRVNADATTPVSCASKTWNVTLTGTTSP